MSNEQAGDFVVVRRHWNDWRLARYRLEDIWNVRWDTTSGGAQVPAPQPFLHGYVQCDAMVEGELSHSCMHGDGPHNIKVCVVKKDNPLNVYNRLVEQAGPKPPRSPSARRTATRRSSLHNTAGKS